jgi:hypothetical protein
MNHFVEIANYLNNFVKIMRDYVSQEENWLRIQIQNGDAYANRVECPPESNGRASHVPFMAIIVKSKNEFCSMSRLAICKSVGSHFTLRAGAAKFM